ncbi:MAG: hypothetical protein ACK55Z_16925, partial [bacterium]
MISLKRMLTIVSTPSPRPQNPTPFAIDYLLHSLYMLAYGPWGPQNPVRRNPSSTRPVPDDAVAACRARRVSRSTVLHSPQFTLYQE